MLNDAKAKMHEVKFDKHMTDLKRKREYGYAAEAKAKTDKTRAKVDEKKHQIEFDKKQETLKKAREEGYASEAKKKVDAQNAKLVELRANKRAEGYAKDAAYKGRLVQVGRELTQFDNAAWHRKAAETYYGLDNLNLIDRTKVGTTKEETAKINPDYSRLNPDTSQNCGFCATAWVMRKKGYDVEAKPDTVGDWNDTKYDSRGLLNIQLEKMFTDPLKTVETKMEVSLFKPTKTTKTVNATRTYAPLSERLNLSSYNSSKDSVDVVREVKSSYGSDRDAFEKNAEKAILNNSKNDNYGILSVTWNSGGGHALNYQVENGKVIVYDGQVNKRYPISELLPRVNSLSYIDCTNCIPTDNVNLVVQNRRK